jgi:hypothetical protein
VKYQLFLNGEKVSREKSRAVESEANVILDQAQAIEAAITRERAHPDEVNHWITLKLIKPTEAEEMFVSYEAAAEVKELGSDTWSHIELGHPQSQGRTADRATARRHRKRGLQGFP